MPKTTWIVIANASTARIYSKTNSKGKSNHQLHLVKELDHPESRKKARELVSDGLGRYRARGELGSGSFSHRTEPKKVEAEHFALELADFLEDNRKHNEFDELVLAMPAHFQGLVKYHSSDMLMNKVKEIIPKDFHQVTQKDLTEMFC